ncbi:SIMPL domain-containing protein [Lutispora sp.]|uniref:SIMPL domain-containing protein n=1 Tax=Lutispora sp. TaxID=2828727 RepID=UPI000EC08D86|nr:SIMPL domain-containing protein [Lutispora sp.]MEA4960935.1 SIMPL domain-containing protein [Lutispora sp.]HCJ58184.1 SIMPL domain-containing protein [Clostridiaceae bacterium]
MNGENKNNLVWSLIAVILALGIILSSTIVTNGIIKMKAGDKTITVTGSAKKQIKSDLVTWRGSFSAQSAQTADAYAKLKLDLEKVKKHLVSKGIDEKDIIISSISTNPYYVVLPNGMYSNEIASYRLEQRVEITSSDVEKITAISREATDLINEGVEFQSYPPEYYYTKIADLKVDMLGEATADAKNRAMQIADGTGSKIGTLRSARVGVFQITPLYSTEVSDYGINDTSTIDKEITAVVTCNFEIE